MPNFATPGMAADQKTFSRRALIAIAVVAVVAIAVTLIIHFLPNHTMRVQMHTTSVAAGVAPGTAIMLNGARVGTVGTITRKSSDDIVVGLSFDDTSLKPALLTSTMQASYAPQSLFGISALVLRTEPGGSELTNNGSFYPDDVEDATLSTLLRNLNDLNNEAFHPYIGDILDKANLATMGLVPVFGIAGQIGTSMARTQVVAPQKTFPQFVGFFSQLGSAVEAALPALDHLLSWPDPQTPGYLERQKRAVTAADNPFTAKDLRDLFGPRELALLNPTGPILNSVLQRVLTSFPDARSNGIEVNELINRVRAAMPTGPNGPVLNLDVIMPSLSAIASAKGSR